MRCLVLTSKDEEALNEVRLGGREPKVKRPKPNVLVVELTDDDSTADLEIGSEEYGFRQLQPELINRFARSVEATWGGGRARAARGPRRGGGRRSRGSLPVRTRA
jgi:hypothetical protein